MNQCKLINHTFKFREGDTDEKGGCTFIGGEWKDVDTAKEQMMKSGKTIFSEGPEVKKYEKERAEAIRRHPELEDLIFCSLLYTLLKV